MKYAYYTKWCDKWHRGGANHPHYSVISTSTMLFITLFDMVCTLHDFYSVSHVVAITSER